MAQIHNPYVVPPVPVQLTVVEETAWGIAYDIYTRRTEADLADGWHSHRANTYNQLVRRLQAAEYFRSQYSDYLRQDIDAATTWVVMMSLMDIQPDGKMESTVKHLKMYTMDRVHLQDVSFQVRLGGQFSTVVRGPTPRNIVHRVRFFLQNWPHALAQLVRLPKHTRPSDAAENPQNWMI